MSIHRLKTIRYFVGVGAALLICSAAHAQTNLDARIEQIIAGSSLSMDQTAVAAAIVNNGRTIVSRNANVPMNPASCTKIITAGAALAQLGPDYRFETTFSSDTKIEGNGQIHNLYIKGNGDPSLVNEELYRIAHALSTAGLKKISGDIVIDDSFFDGQSYPKKDGNDGRAYTAHTSAVAVNFNSLKLSIAPGARNGAPAKVTTEPPTPYIDIVNKVRTGGKFRIYIKRGPHSPDRETFIVSGSIPLRANPQDFYRSLSQPLKYSGYAVKQILNEAQIAVDGSVREGVTPEGSHVLLKFSSKPLSDIVQDMNKFSNNFIAEQIVKHLGAIKKGGPGSTQKGILVLNDFMSSINSRSNGYVLENGSGLTENNRVSARQLVDVLVSLYQEGKIRAPFVESLSILGVDGTMARWRGSPQLTGLLRAKTGSLANVSTLAGYVPTSDGKLAAFAILSNGFKKGRLSAHDAQLMIVSAIAESN